MNIIITLLIVLSVLACLHGKKAKRYVVSVEKERCTGCGRCISQCKHKVLAMEQDKTKNIRFAVVKNPTQCSACGHCMKACRFQALQLCQRIAPLS